MIWPDMPKTLRQGAVWLLLGYTISVWAGWMHPPWSALEQARQREERTANQILQSEREVQLLRYQMDQVRGELNRVNGKLEEMAMVLYSMEARSARVR